MRQLFRFLVIFIVFFGINSCSNSSDNNSTPPTTTTFNATLDGISEARMVGNSSTATGTAILSFNTTTKIFTVTVNYTGLTPTLAHIHKGAIGVSGGVVFPLNIENNPINYTSAALTESQEADLNNNLYYINIHTAAYPGGEIRGQLIKYVGQGY